MAKGKPEQTLHRIGWLDSVNMPAHIHKTNDDGKTTVCGHHPLSEPNWKITSRVPRKVRGSSQYCRECFKDGGKSLPFLPIEDPRATAFLNEKQGYPPKRSTVP